jgi:hypothetical protein
MSRWCLAPAANSQICVDFAAEKGIDVQNNWSDLSVICHHFTLSPVAYRPCLRPLSLSLSLYANSWLHLPLAEPYRNTKQFRRIHAKEYSKKKAVGGDLCFFLEL